MKRVIILNGSARAGKDTFANHIKIRADLTEDMFAHSLSTVDEVKRICKEFGVGDEKTDADRKLWSDVKDLWTAYNDGPFNDITTRISYLYGGENVKSIYIVMCREPEEIAKFKKHYGEECRTILIRRPGLDIPNNHADMNVENYEYDIEISNSGSKENLIGMAYHVCDTIFDD